MSAFSCRPPLSSHSHTGEWPARLVTEFTLYNDFDGTSTTHLSPFNFHCSTEKWSSLHLFHPVFAPPHFLNFGIFIHHSSRCQPTCPAFIKMNISAPLVPASCWCTWRRLALLTPATFYEPHFFVKLFFLFTSFSFFPHSFRWNNEALLRPARFCIFAVCC